MSRPTTSLSGFEDRLFTERHIRIVSAVLLGVNVGLFVWALVTGQSVFVVHGEFGASDFAHSFVAALLAESGHAAAVYDPAAFATSQQALFGALVGASSQLHFPYPPPSLIFLYALALVPFVVAFAGWVTSTFMVYTAAAYAILPRAAMLMAAAGTAVALKNAQLGQSGFLTAGLIGLALVFLERRPVLAGIFIGLLIYKPHFGILFPLALVAGRQWKAFASAAATVLLLAAIATIAFGAHVWSAFFASLHGFDGTLTADPGFEIGFQSLFGLLRWYGASPLLALSAHMVFAALLTVLVCTLWWLPTPYPLKAAALCIGAVAVTPYVLAYDLCALAMAVAFFVQDGLRRGFYAGERVTLLVCFMLAAFLARPFGALLDAVLIGVVVWRLVAERRELRAFAGAPVSL